MIKTKNKVVIALPNNVTLQPHFIYSRVLEVNKNFLDEIIEVKFEDFYYISENIDEPIRSGSYKVSKELYNTLLSSMGSIDSYETELAVIDQAHAHINNGDGIYGTEWEVV